MKIVFVSDAIYPYLHGGKEKRLFEISTRLSRAGHDVHIYTMHWWEKTESNTIEEGVKIHALCKYYEMYNNDHRTIKEGIMFGLACFKLFTVKFDVLDVDHMPFFPILIAWFVCICTLRRKRFFGTWHEALTRKEWIEYMGVAGNVASLIERICIQMPYTITAVSADTQKLLMLQRRRKSSVQLVTPGIDYKAMQSIKPASIRCDILTVCRLVKNKNVDMLISSVAIVTKTKPSIKCIIVGKGPEKHRLVEQVESLGLNQNVTFVESLPQSNDVYAYMKAAAVFCLPTIREGFGIVTLEALGCGTPVITINAIANASRKFIKDGENGSIISLDSNAVVKAINHWLGSKRKESVNIAQNASKFDWDILAKKQVKVYMI